MERDRRRCREEQAVLQHLSQLVVLLRGSCPGMSLHCLVCRRRVLGDGRVLFLLSTEPPWTV